MDEQEDIPRVSRILDTIDWGIKKAPGFILRRYGKYGTSFHELVSKKLRGERTRVSPRFKTKYRMFTEWLKQYEVLESEKKVLWTSSEDASRRYRGTLDLVLKRKADNKIVLADIKTGKFYKRHWYQVSAYKNAYEAMTLTHVDEMLLVRPTEESVEEQLCPNRVMGFLAILNIYADIQNR